jgi:hypothetical protein
MARLSNWNAKKWFQQGYWIENRSWIGIFEAEKQDAAMLRHAAQVDRLL